MTVYRRLVGRADAEGLLAKGPRAEDNGEGLLTEGLRAEDNGEGLLAEGPRVEDNGEGLLAGGVNEGLLGKADAGGLRAAADG